MEELHLLLQEETGDGRNGWYEACDHLGQTTTFVADVARAWQLANVISLQCRYALIVASLNSMAANIPGELMAALVKQQLWTPAQGLAYALQVVETPPRVRAIQELAPYLPDSLLLEALTVARFIQNEYYRASALTELVPHLPEILPEALTAAHSIQNKVKRASALTELVPHLPEILPEALVTARSIRGESDLTSALTELASHFPEILPEALTAARSIQDEYYRTNALIRLAPQLPEILSEALAAACSTQNSFHRAYDLVELAFYFPEILPEALAVIDSLEHEVNRAGALGTLIPQLNPVSIDIPFCNKTMRVLVHNKRQQLLRDVSSLSPTIIALGGIEALAETAKAIQDVCRQWP